MKVLNPHETTLPNAEVHTFLSSLIARYASHPDFAALPAARLRRLHRVTRDVISYFEGGEGVVGVVDAVDREFEESKAATDGSSLQNQNGDTDIRNDTNGKSVSVTVRNTGYRPYDALTATTTETNAKTTLLQSRITSLLASLQTLPTRTGNASDKLTKAEALMLVNVIPIDEPVLECVVEEVEERYDEAQRAEMMRLCRWFGNLGPDGDEEVEDGGGLDGEDREEMGEREVEMEG